MLEGMSATLEVVRLSLVAWSSSYSHLKKKFLSQNFHFPFEIFHEFFDFFPGGYSSHTSTPRGRNHHLVTIKSGPRSVGCILVELFVF